jgi:uracil-DNA glycosylase
LLSNSIDPSWHADLNHAMSLIDSVYLESLMGSHHWLPGQNHCFNAFSQPKSHIKYVLLGESPYPRPVSANGYAFWDNDVGDLWSQKGLSSKVNRATSLRNFLKMLLHAEDLLKKPFLASDIAQIDKTRLYQTLDDLFINMQNKGFLLLNASLVWSADLKVQRHAKAWFPFIKAILEELLRYQPTIKILLFGKMAEKFKFLPSENILVAEHPYVLNFIDNQDVLKFFKPLHLLRK